MLSDLAALSCRTCQDALLKFASAVGWGLLVQHDAKGMFPEVGGAAAAAAVAACLQRLAYGAAQQPRWFMLLGVGNPRHTVPGTCRP